MVARVVANHVLQDATRALPRVANSNGLLWRAIQNTRSLCLYIDTIYEDTRASVALEQVASTSVSHPKAQKQTMSIF